MLVIYVDETWIHAHYTVSNGGRVVSAQECMLTIVPVSTGGQMGFITCQMEVLLF
jgi:hypothetical protein